jgi:hypothetical protein
VARGGRILISAANLATAITPPIADLRATHVFNPEWPPHARFHAFAYVCIGIVLGSASLWLLWRKTTDRAMAVTVAALVPVAYWGPFFVAVFVPGASFEDHPHSLPRPLSMPINLWVSAGVVAAAVAGWLWYRLGEAESL